MNSSLPDTRQLTLAERLNAGQHIVAAAVAAEFDVSVDTIRRDLLTLEAEGTAQRVRGGAIPINPPARPLHKRLVTDDDIDPKLIRRAVAAIGDARTLMCDGGTTVLAVLGALPALPDRFIITPSPWVAVACQERGIAVFVIGGNLSGGGGVTTGARTLSQIADVAVDIAVLGACGMHPTFGLSTDHWEESQIKQAMHTAAHRTFVVADAAKIGTKARHRTLPLSDIDALITNASDTALAPFRNNPCALITPDTGGS